MTKTSKVFLWIVLILVILGVWYFFSYKNEGQEVYPSNTVGLNTAPKQTVVKVSTDAKLGKYLVASNGMTLYRFTKDTVKGASNCYGTCALNWPAYSPISSEILAGGEGVTGLLGTITRTDGLKQLTYKNMPVYFWKNDKVPGDTTGQNVGGVWFVVQP